MDLRPFGRTQRAVSVVGQGTGDIDRGPVLAAIAALRSNFDEDDLEEAWLEGGRVLQEIAAAHGATPETLPVL